MSHGLDPVETGDAAAPDLGAVSVPDRVLDRLNYFIVLIASIGLVVASCVLTYSVVTRYFLHYSTDWQDEISVFLIVGAVFMSAAAVQARRGHVGIEAIVGLLSPRANRVRMMLVDFATLLFCGYFSWKSVLLLHEAIVEGFRTSSTFQPPLWIPYSLMTAGMILLSVQVLLQLVGHFRSVKGAAR